MPPSTTRGLCLFYFLLGVQLTLPDLGTSLWLIRAGVEVARLGAITATLGVPWCLKPLYGLVSDAFPLRGRRRRPYIIGGNLAAAAAWLALAYVPPEHPHAETAGVALLLFASLSTCVVDVMYDACLVVAVRGERDAAAHGLAQSNCWAARAAGALCAALGSGFLLGVVRHPRDIFLVQAALTTGTAALAAALVDERRRPPTRVPGGACTRLVLHAKDTVDAWRATPALWRSALFVFVFAATPSSYGALFYFMVRELRFSAGTLGALQFARHSAMLAGTLLYRRCCRHAPFRRFFVLLVLFSAALSCTPVVLVTRANAAWGVPDAAFATGDDVALSIVGQVAQMPLLVLAAKLCPPGIEAALYASFVSVMNFSGVVSGWTGALATHAWGVTKDDFTHLEALILTCAATSLLPLAFVWLLPRGGVADLVARRGGEGGR
jgi:folate/biopterin transporter